MLDVNKAFIGLLMPLLLFIATTGCRSLDAGRYPTPKEWQDEHHSNGAGKVQEGVGTNTAAMPASLWHSVRMVETTDLPRPHCVLKDQIQCGGSKMMPIPFHQIGISQEKDQDDDLVSCFNPFHNFDNCSDRGRGP